MQSRISTSCFVLFAVAAFVLASGIVGARASGDDPPPNNVFISGGDLEYGGIYSLDQGSLTDNVYTNGKYYMWPDNDSWVITDSQHRVLFRTGYGFPSGVVPQSLQFNTVLGGPPNPPRMDQAAPPNTLSLKGDVNATASISINENGYNAWYVNFMNILVYSGQTKTKADAHSWLISEWPSMNMLFYSDEGGNLPPKTGWKKADGSEADLTVYGQQTGYVSHMTQGDANWVDYMTLDNLGADKATYTLEFYPVGSAALTNYEIGGGASVLLNLKNLAPSATCAKVSTSPGVKIRAGYRNTGSGGVAEFYLDDFNATSVGYFFTTFNTSATWKGLSIMNPGDTTANVTLYAYGESTLLGTGSETVAAKTRVVGTTGKWFSGLSMGDIVRVMAVSDQPVLGIVITGNDDSSQITFTQGSSADGFSAPAQ